MQRRFLLPVASGISGVALAHGLAYALAGPTAAGGAEDGHAVGHGYWHHAAEFGLLAASVAVLLAAARGLSPDRAGRVGFRAGLPRTVGWQISLFACLEAVERVASGGSLPGLFGEPVFWVGVLVQAITAVVVLAVLIGIEEVVAAVADARPAAGWPLPDRPLVCPLALAVPRQTPAIRAVPAARPPW